MRAEGRGLPILPMLLLSLVQLLGCGAGEVAYEMGEWIQMGPFTFAVQRATDQLTMATPGRPSRRVVRVDLQVDLDRSEPAKVKFDDFLNDMTDDRMIVFPALKLVDSEGNEFDGLVERVSGMTRWKAEFDLVIVHRGMRSAEYLKNLRASDLRLRIRNIDRRKGQSAAAVIQLE